MAQERAAGEQPGPPRADEQPEPLTPGTPQPGPLTPPGVDGAAGGHHNQAEDKACFQGGSQALSPHSLEPHMAPMRHKTRQPCTESMAMTEAALAVDAMTDAAAEELWVGRPEQLRRCMGLNNTHK